MSIIAKKPIPLPKGTTVTIDKNRQIVVKGKNGELNFQYSELVEVGLDNDLLSVNPIKNIRNSSMYAGTTRALLNNMVVGVSEGFEKKLILEGVGYRSEIKGTTLLLSLGYSHVIKFEIPKDIKLTVSTPTEVTVWGIDKQQVGQVASDIRSYRKPEPYKGKGIRYHNEIIKRKEAKKK